MLPKNLHRLPQGCSIIIYCRHSYSDKRYGQSLYLIKISIRHIIGVISVIKQPVKGTINVMIKKNEHDKCLSNDINITFFKQNNFWLKLLRPFANHTAIYYQ